VIYMLTMFSINLVPLEIDCQTLRKTRYAFIWGQRKYIAVLPHRAPLGMVHCSWGVENRCRKVWLESSLLSLMFVVNCDCIHLFIELRFLRCGHNCAVAFYDQQLTGSKTDVILLFGIIGQIVPNLLCWIELCYLTPTLFSRWEV
jgi:hypothetical protein